MVKHISFLLASVVLLMSCSTQKLPSLIKEKFPNGLQRIYLVNNWVVSPQNNLCKTVSDSCKANKIKWPSSVYYNDFQVWDDVVEVMRRNLSNVVMDGNTKKCIDEIKDLKPQLIIVIQPWYFTRRDAFLGQAPFPHYKSNDFAEVTIYDAHNFKRLEVFELPGVLNDPHFSTSEMTFGKQLYERLKSLTLLQP
jgi:hypothetical protein